MIDFDKYIGLPFKLLGCDEKGLDCLGLIYHFYKQEYQVEIPRMDIEGTEYQEFFELDPTDRMDNYLMSIGSFRRAPNQGDVVTFRGYQNITHCGIYINEGVFMHAYRNVGTVITSEMNSWFPMYAGAVRVRR